MSLNDTGDQGEQESAVSAQVITLVKTVSSMAGNVSQAEADDIL
jgi:hypothetical protein